MLGMRMVSMPCSSLEDFPRAAERREKMTSGASSALRGLGGWIPAVIVALLLLPISPLFSKAAAKPQYCEGCHGPGAIMPLSTNPNPGVLSQRAHMLENGPAVGKGKWTARGIHAIDDILAPGVGSSAASCRLCHYSTCVSCHNYQNYKGIGKLLTQEQIAAWYNNVHAPTSPETITYPNDPSHVFPTTNPEDTNCAAHCHAWVMGDCVTNNTSGNWQTTQACGGQYYATSSWENGNVPSEAGFANLLGSPDTSYAGPISPDTLLTNTATAHGDLYNNFNNFGCAGFCHGGAKNITQHGTDKLAALRLVSEPDSVYAWYDRSIDATMPSLRCGLASVH